MDLLKGTQLSDMIPLRVCLYRSLFVLITRLCVFTEMDFLCTAREQRRQNALAALAATQVSLEGKQRTGLLLRDDN